VIRHATRPDMQPDPTCNPTRHATRPDMQLDPTCNPPTNACATCNRLPCRRGLCSDGLPCEPGGCGPGRSSPHEIVAKNKVFRFAAIVKPLRTRWVYEWEGWSEMRKM
jgi:hypothetical protein